MFNKILFPTDGSENSLNALKYVKNLASNYNATVVVLNVYDVPLLYTEEIEEVLKEEGFNILGNTKNELAGLNVKTRLIKGNIGNIIVETAKEESTDLIIMGTRGLSEIKSFLVGSNSNFVIHHSKIPVMLV